MPGIPRITEEQKKYIDENYGTQTVDTMCNHLSITYKMVYGYCARKGYNVFGAYRTTRKPQEPDWEAGGIFRIDRYNPATI